MSDSPRPHSAAPSAKKDLFARIKNSRFLWISILFHLLLIVVAGILVVQVITQRKQTFKAPAAAPTNRAVEHQIQMAKKQQSMSAPAMKRIATTGLSKVVLPAMPVAETPSTPTLAPASGLTPGFGMGSSMAGGSGAGAGGGIPLFGLRTGGIGLEGTFYDLKQTRSRKPTQKWTEKSYRAFAATLARRNLSDTPLNPYYRGKDKLSTPQIMMPSIRADEGPKGFGVEKDVAPSYWMVVYKAKVTPSRSGVIHFVGAADDIMLVKFQGHIILDGSLYHGLGVWKADKEYNYDNNVRDTFLKNRNAGGWARSDAIKVQAGQWYDLVVVIGEAPGGFFDASLLIEEEGVTYEKDGRGNPILPPFRLSNVEVTPAQKGRSLPYAKDGPIWKTQAPSGGGLN